MRCQRWRGRLVYRSAIILRPVPRSTPIHPPAPSPESEAELRLRAQRLSGLSLADLARTLGERPPADLRHAKGWVGEALERALGASSGSQPEPDFSELGIELKSIPIGHDGLPRESTYVSTVPLAGLGWEASLIRRKLARLLPRLAHLTPARHPRRTPFHTAKAPPSPSDRAFSVASPC